MQRQFWMRPDEEVERIYEYCLAEAAARFKVTLFGWVAMSNHQHVLVKDNEGNLPEFVAHLNKMTAKALNAYWGRRENLWAAEQPSNVWLTDPDVQFEKLIYLLTNPVSADLVDRVTHWPGASSLAQNLSGEAKVVHRPETFFREDGVMPVSVTLRAERLEGYEHLTQLEWREKLLSAIREAEEAARRRRAETGKRVLGRKVILRAKPTDTPSTVEPFRRYKPLLACSDPQRREAELLAIRAFREAYREALLKLRAREPAVFPPGTYALVRLGIWCADEPCFAARPMPPLAVEMTASLTAPS